MIDFQQHPEKSTLRNIWTLDQKFKRTSSIGRDYARACYGTPAWRYVEQAFLDRKP